MTTLAITHAFADNFRLAKSKLFSSPGDDTYHIVPVPKYSFVKDVWIQVITAANVTPDACSVGWIGNGETAVPAGFITMDVAEPNKTGLKRAQNDTLTTFSGKYFSEAGGLITFTYAAGSATTMGVYRILVEYTVIH